MLIAGGVLKGIGGGGGAAGGGGGGGVNAGTTPDANLGISPNDIPTLERENPATNVSINVSGIITNPRETAQQIADLLKDGFDTSDLNTRGLV
jgi:hypothetical protein